MTLDDWLEWCRRDADRRGLHDLTPLIDALGASARRLRSAHWNDDQRVGKQDTTTPAREDDR